MKGYIYRLYSGADPAKGWIFNDPIFDKPATLGACVPNVRRNVEVGDWVFSISGRVPDYLPYVVGGFQVDEKIDAIQAYERFPDYRLSRAANGQVVGNIIVDAIGQQQVLDRHTNFEGRLENYLVGWKAIHVSKSNAIEQSRAETVSTLSRLFDKPANRSFDVVPRWRRLEETQVHNLIEWLQSINS